MKTNTSKLALTSFLVPLIVSCLSYAGPLDLCSQFTKNCSIQKQVFQGPDVPQDQYVLDVTLGLLSEAQYKELRAQFHTSMMAPFDAQKSYKLVDFLPPFIQKTNGRVLVPHTLPAAPELLAALKAQGKAAGKLAYVDGNCHSVTWQWVNYLQDQGTSEALLTLADGEWLNLDLKINPNDVQAGDVLVIKGTGGYGQVDEVLHSLVYLGYGLVFEKGNPGKEYPYRMSYLKDVVSKYKEVDASAAFEFYRIHSGSPILPALKSKYSLVTAENQKAFDLQLQNLPSALLEQYILQETWDNSKGVSVFTLGRILNDSEANPKNWYSILKK